MATRRAFLQSLAGLGGVLLPWSGWTKLTKHVNSRIVCASDASRYVKQTTNFVSGPDSSYLKRTATDDIMTLAKPEFQGRLAGSVGEEKAAAFLINQLQGLGLKPLGDTVEDQQLYSHAFTIYPVVEEYKNFYFGPHLTFALGNPNGLRTPSANVIGGLMGTDTNESIILSAHYDHMGIYNGNVYPGANDNASGVGCILDVMRRLIREGVKPKRNVVSAFWSAEEMGFVGSFSYLKNPTVPLNGIKAVFNADTVGNGPLQEFALWADGDNIAVQTIQSVADDYNVSALLTPNYGYNSDQYYFNLEHIPAVTLMARDWLNKNHTPEDIPSIINPQKVALGSEIIYKSVQKLAFE